MPSRYAVLVNRLDDEPTEEFAVTSDLGLGGLSLVSRDSFGVDTHLKLLVTIDGVVVEMRCRVVYENELPDHRVELGVEFIEIRPTHLDMIARVVHAVDGA